MICLFKWSYVSFFFLHVFQVVSEAVYKRWSVDRKNAMAAIENRERLVMDTAVQLEKNLTLLGDTSTNRALVAVYCISLW